MQAQDQESAETLLQRVIAFRDAHIYPNEARFTEEVAAGPTRWKPVPVLEELRTKARGEGLWNLALQGNGGPGLSHAQYAPIAEAMGGNEWAPEVFNCHPPDTGNMAILRDFGTEAQKAAWLTPLLNGDIRTCFAMTEPEVASSDATNIALKAERCDGGWRIEGRKWWISGPGNPLCRLAIVMARTAPEAERGRQHSTLLVPMDAPGVSVVRQLTIFGCDFAPRGFSELKFADVFVPDADVLGEPGMGFKIAQARLGGARVHHAMRCVGAAERALRLMCERASARVAFGKPIAQLGGAGEIIAQCRIEINMVRALILSTAALMDNGAPARSEISQVKVAAPAMAARVIDAAMQMHGAAGLSQDTPLAALYARIRSIRIADGPDAVHLRTIAREELALAR